MVKTSKKRKQNETVKSWCDFVKATWLDMKKRSGKDVLYKNAMKEASRRKKHWKKGGATSIANSAAPVSAPDAQPDTPQTAKVGGRRRRRRKTSKKRTSRR